MYRVYLRDFQGRVPAETKTITSNQASAAEAFESLVNRTDLDGQKLAAVLSYNNGQLAFHRFDRQPGSADYWRDKLDAIEWPQRGGARDGSGVKPADGATDLKRSNITIDPASAEILRAYGDGDLSLGIRRAARLVAAGQR